jgi:hypothetical protein
VDKKLSSFDDEGATGEQQAVAGHLELDPVTKENISRDAKNLQDMASQIQLVAEGLCHDLGLELPPNLKKRIVKKVA